MEGERFATLLRDLRTTETLPTMPFGDIVMLTRFRGAEQSKVEL